MATYPGGIYSYTVPSPNSPRNNPSLSGEVSGAAAEVVAIETALGVNMGNVAGIAQTAVASVSVGGDLSGTVNSATVSKVHGVSVPATPLANQFIVASGSVASQWQYGVTVASVTTANAASVAIAAYNPVVLANGTFNITLPSPSSTLGETVTIKNVGSGSVGVIQHTSEKIDGAASVALYTQYEAVRVCTDGTNWYVIGQAATSIL